MWVCVMKRIHSLQEEFENVAQLEGDSDWINAAAAVIFVCALACIILPSFRELHELVVIVLDTSCLLKPCEGPLCTLVEAKKAASFLWSGFCFLYCKIAFIFAFDSHWMSLCIITVMFWWYSKYWTRSVLHDSYSTLKW